MSPAATVKIGGISDGLQSNLPRGGRGHSGGCVTVRRETQAYLKRRRDAFTNPLVYTFWGNQGPSIMTMTAALAE
jgi:hypothetical protein